MAADPSRNLKLEENQSTSKLVGTLPRRVAMEGYLLKRSETLRRWNQRWFSLDPTTAKMEYRTQRDELQPRGYIVFDVDSTVLVSPINFHGAKEYENCCFYIATPRKKDYYLCAETPAAARAWVATIRAACLVLEAHKDAVSSLTDGGRTQMAGAVKAAAASAAAIAVSHAKDIAVANQKAVLSTQQGHHRLQQNAALMKITSELQQQQQQQQTAVETDQDRLTIMRETLRVKDEELQHLLAELRARDATIRDMTLRLSQTAEAAEAAAAAAHDIDRNRSAAVAKIGEICKDAEAKLEAAAEQVKASSAREAAALAERDRALAEASMWRSEAELAERLVRGLQAQLLAATRSQDNANAAASKVTGAAEVPHDDLVPAPASTTPEPGPVTGLNADMVVTSGAGELQVDDTRNGTLPVNEPDNDTSASVSGISSGNNCTAEGQGSDDEHPPSPGYTTRQLRELPKGGEGMPVSETDMDALSDKGGNSEARDLNPQGRANTNEADLLEELDLDVDFLQPALVQMKVSGLDPPADDHVGGGSHT